MSKRRQPNETVLRRAGSCFLADTEPALVRLTGVQDGDLHDNDTPCCLCDDPECREWANVQVVGGPHAGGWLYHLSECEMGDVTP